ncbi:major facilitator superfamily domain-containing protein [Sparassis latifolia]|uniref:General alpha-glucoside permease n=1 Tax=Sparassis crispa TaxID=139825 RepID=A0A401GPK2_9APHY|nr:General alpha-glucoside permease [Sparassis crispa]GBE83684.1 General alpha-glucoside permease [Sparassis crispa]
MTGFAAVPIAEEGGEDSRLTGVSKVLGPRWLQLPTLTVGLLGVQVFWSIEMSYATPYLISLGLSKSAVAVVFLAGPVSGLVVQPVIGLLTDNSKSRFGRRRPYMLAGTCICITAMLLLGFTRPFASLFVPSGSIANHLLTIWLAIIALFSVDFSINAVQAVDRALVVDILPPSDQAEGNAWAARMLGIGSVAGYFVGNVDMTTVFPFLGDTELEVLSIVGSFFLVSMHLITAICTKEKVVVANKLSSGSFIKELKTVWYNARNLPSVIRQICIIQFCAWLGWFPNLFYTTAFIGDLHKRAYPDVAQDDPVLDAEAIRLGSRALFYSSILSLSCNIVLPFFVSEAATSREMLERKLSSTKNIWAQWYHRMKVHLATLWAISHLVFAICMAATFFYSSVAGATFFTTLTGFSWAITQWAPFSLLAEAILTNPLPANEDANSIILHDTRTQRRSGDITFGSDANERQFLVAADDDVDDDSTLEDDVHSFRSSASMEIDLNDDRRSADGVHVHENPLMGNPAARASHLQLPSSIDGGDEEDDEVSQKHHGEGGLADKAGIILGIHNIFIVMPQFIMTALASIIFAILEPGKSVLSGHRGGFRNSTLPATNSTGNNTEAELFALDFRDEVNAAARPNSYAIVFRLGGIAAAIAFVLTVRLARQLRHQ